MVVVQVVVTVRGNGDFILQTEFGLFFEEFLDDQATWKSKTISLVGSLFVIPFLKFLESQVGHGLWHVELCTRNGTHILLFSETFNQ